MNDFCLDIRGYCFICLHRKHDLQGLSTSFCSFQSFSKFLKVDMTKLFNEKVQVPPDLLEKVVRSRLKVTLCPECASFTENFSGLFDEIEKIRVKMMGYLNGVRGRMEEAEKKGWRSDGGGENMDKERLFIARAMRKEVIDKCSIKLQGNLPVVALKRLSGKILCMKTTQDVPGVERHENSDVGQRTKISANAMLPSSSSKLTINAEDKLLASSVKDEIAQLISVPKLTISSKGTGPFSCNLCGKRVKSRQSLQDHYDCVHLKVRRFQCDKCPRKFFLKENMLKHRNNERVHSRLFGYKAGKEIGTKIDTVHPIIRNHMKGLEGFSKKQKVACKICGKILRNKYILQNHLKIIHIKLLDYSCELCDKKFSCHSSLANHRKTHCNSKFPCGSPCRRKFNNESQLNEHRQLCLIYIRNEERHQRLKLGQESSKQERYQEFCESAPEIADFRTDVDIKFEENYLMII